MWQEWRDTESPEKVTVQEPVRVMEENKNSPMPEPDKVTVPLTPVASHSDGGGGGDPEMGEAPPYKKSLDGETRPTMYRDATQNTERPEKVAVQEPIRVMEENNPPMPEPDNVTVPITPDASHSEGGGGGDPGVGEAPPYKKSLDGETRPTMYRYATQVPKK